MRVSSAVLLALTLTGCGSPNLDRTELSRTRGRDCLITGNAPQDNDDLVYSNVATDSLTEDQSGFELMFRGTRRGWTGRFREATGELGRERPIADLSVDTSHRTVTFALPNGADTSRFEGQISCDSIWGRFQAYRTTPFELVSFRRVTP